LAARLLAFTLLLASAGSALATVHYVDVNSTHPTPPYTNWTTAATNIQDAVDASIANDEIVVTNGTYATGGRVDGTMNRVFVDKQLNIRSVNGALSTIIDGGGSARCVALYYGGTLSGFTLTRGSSYNGSGADGGTLNNCILSGNSAVGWYSEGGGAYYCTLNNCVLSGNSAAGPYGYGGAAYNCALSNCVLTGNSAYQGGGTYGGTLNNCTLTANSASGSGGGAYGCTLNNCITYFNTAPQGANYDFSSFFNYCCTTPLPVTGAGNISVDPQLASASHLSIASPCRGAGNAAYATGVDIDGEAWFSPPSIGCDEYHAGAATGPLSVAAAASLTKPCDAMSAKSAGPA